ncbi:MAG: hypothetical protein R2710_30830 [Acidimicrobiales bacterium]
MRRPETSSAGGDALPIAVDVTDSAAVADAVHQTVTVLAGSTSPSTRRCRPAADAPLAEEQFDRVLDVNL